MNEYIYEIEANDDCVLSTEQLSKKAHDKGLFLFDFDVAIKSTVYSTINFDFYLRAKKLVRIEKLYDDAKVELNELIEENFDSTDSSVAFLKRKVRSLKALRSLLKVEFNEFSFEEIRQSALIAQAEQTLLPVLTKKEREFYFGFDFHKPKPSASSLFFHKGVHEKKYRTQGAAKRFSLQLYKRDKRKLSLQIFSEVFKKHSNILGEDDYEMNNNKVTYSKQSFYNPNIIYGFYIR